MTAYIEYCLSFINQWLLSPAAALVLLFAGIVLSVKLKFFHLKNPLKLARLMFEKKNGTSHSPFRALTVALAGTLGVGNISGVALALSYGGAGSIFWMWVSALCAMIVKYSEIVLAVYHRDVRDGNLHGGAMYYIKHGLRKKGLSSLLAVGFACFCIFSSLSTGSIIQVNAVSEAFEGCFSISPVIVGAVMAALTAYALFSSKSEKVSDITVKLVPFMSAIFIGLSLFIILRNVGDLPEILGMIFKDAFTPNSAIGGIGGYVFSKSVRFGVTRGLFSNEAGCGTSTIAHAKADSSSARSQGVWGIFEVFFDTVVLCTLTAFVLLLTYKNNIPQTDEGVMMSLLAYKISLGSVAQNILAVSIFLFAYATLICWAFYGCECVYFLCKSPRAKKIYLCVYITSIIYGAIAPSSLTWSLADSSICIMLIVNTVCVLLMSDTVKKLSEEKSGA